MDNPPSKPVKIDGKQMDKVRWIVHSKLKPFYIFKLRRINLSDTNYLTDNPSLVWIRPMTITLQISRPWKIWIVSSLSVKIIKIICLKSKRIHPRKALSGHVLTIPHTLTTCRHTKKLSYDQQRSKQERVVWPHSEYLLTRYQSVAQNLSDMWRAPLWRSACCSFSPLQKSRLNHGSHAWTETPSGMFFVLARYTVNMS